MRLSKRRMAYDTALFKQNPSLHANTHSQKALAQTKNSVITTRACARIFVHRGEEREESDRGGDKAAARGVLQSAASPIDMIPTRRIHKNMVRGIKAAFSAIKVSRSEARAPLLAAHPNCALGNDRET